MANRAKSNSKKDGKAFLKEAFDLEQKVLQVQMELSGKSITHDGAMGSVNENHFISFLRKYLPRRYAVDSGIVIDSNGSTSDQIDIIIYDPQYTPTLLDQNNHRYIPAESVYAVFEVKPTINKKNIKYAGDKVESVRKLHRTSIEIHHAGGKFPKKKLFPIIAGIVSSNMEWTDGFEGESFKKSIHSLTGDKSLDFCLSVSGGCFHADEADQNHKPNGRSLIYFIFRLLQRLQTLGTVPAVDWNAYAVALNHHGGIHGE